MSEIGGKMGYKKRRVRQHNPRDFRLYVNIKRSNTIYYWVVLTALISVIIVRIVF